MTAKEYFEQYETVGTQTFDLLEKSLPAEILDLFPRRDGPARLAAALSEHYGKVRVNDINVDGSAWVRSALFYRSTGRPFEAIAILSSLYEHLLRCQQQNRARYHKGLPLVWLSDCYRDIGFAAIAKRYLMLTLIEDAISTRGTVDTDAGVYFRVVWTGGLSDNDVRRYFEQANSLYAAAPDEGAYPESILQQLDLDWMREIPSASESTKYTISSIFAAHLIDGLGTSGGRSLERLAGYLLSCIPGCRVWLRAQTPSTDLDVVATIEGPAVDFRADLGRYIVCECKDWQDSAGFTSIAKFCRVLDSVKAKFGILFSREGITGQTRTTDASRELLKVFQDRAVAIVVVNRADIAAVAAGVDFISMLRDKYETVRLDLRR